MQVRVIIHHWMILLPVTTPVVCSAPTSDVDVLRLGVFRMTNCCQHLPAMSGKWRVVFPDSTVSEKKKSRRWFSLYFAEDSVLANNIIAGGAIAIALPQTPRRY